MTRKRKPPAPDADLPPLRGAPDPPHVPTGTGFFAADGREFPPTHPDHGPMNRLPRQQDGSFAAYYYCSKDELAGFGIDDGPPPRRHRHDGWTPEKQAEFLEILAATASVSEACAAVDRSRRSAYALRNRPDAVAFRDGWDEALRASLAVLATTAFDRAVNGQEEIVFYKGQRVGCRWKYDNRLLMFLLRVRDPLNYAPLDDLQGWLRHRDIQPPPDLDAPVERLIEAEREWGKRIEPGSRGESPPRLAAPSKNTALPESSPADPPPDRPPAE